MSGRCSFVTKMLQMVRGEGVVGRGDGTSRRLGLIEASELGASLDMAVPASPAPCLGHINRAGERTSSAGRCAVPGRAVAVCGCC